MKKFFLMALSLVFLASCASPEEQKPQVVITANGVDDAAVKMTIPGSDSLLSQGVLKAGSVTLLAPINTPQMLQIDIEGMSIPVVFYADLTQMTIDIDGTTTPPKFDIKGSVYNDSLEAFGERQNANRNFMNSLRGGYEQAVQANDSLTIFVITQQADSAYAELNEYTEAFAKRNGILGTMVAMRFLYDADYTTLQEIYEGVPVRYKNAKDVVEFKERMDILEKTQIGKRFIDITQKDTTGQDLSISSIQAEYILIDFWASWCGPCRAANPDLVKIHSDFKEKGFQIVGVSLDQKADDWKKAIVDDQLNWPQMSDLKGWQNEGAAAYAIRAIPQSVIIDNQGFIVNKNLTPEELRAFLEDKLN